MTQHAKREKPVEGIWPKRAMAEKMTRNAQCSQKLSFLNKKNIGLGFLRGKIAAARDIDETLRKEVLKSLKETVGNQEIEWISKNGEERLVEYLIHRHKFKNYPKQRRLGPFPLHLLIEPTPVCNLNCVMCFQRDDFFRKKENIGAIDFDFFRSLVDQAVENGCKALTMASRGEPILHKGFGRMLNYCKGKFLELKINTNATMLNEKICRDILDAGVDIVVFSADNSSPEEYEKTRVGAKFEKVVENIGLFDEIRKSKRDYGKTATRVSGVYLNQDKKEFLDFWKNRADSVTMHSALARWDTYNNKTIEFGKPCGLLWERMYVWFDGKCNPCDSDYRSILTVGNAKEKPLKEIWAGKKYAELRNRHLEGKRASIVPCNQCDVRLTE